MAGIVIMEIVVIVVVFMLIVVVTLLICVKRKNKTDLNDVSSMKGEKERQSPSDPEVGGA